MLKVALLKLLLIFHWRTDFVHGVTGLNRCYHEYVCIVKIETSWTNKNNHAQVHSSNANIKRNPVLNIHARIMKVVMQHWRSDGTWMTDVEADLPPPVCDTTVHRVNVHRATEAPHRVNYSDRTG